MKNILLVVVGIGVVILLDPVQMYWRLYYLYRDLIVWFKSERYKFQEYGCTIFVGEQGSGKTIGMVWYLNRMKKKYPDIKIITNFGYSKEDYKFEDWKQLLKIRNGEKGVIFAIDEIQNEYDNRKWRDFPETILSEITQQRKQRIKVILSAQYYIDVVVQLRRQCFEVVECSTRFKRISRRLTTLKCYKAREYEVLQQLKESGRKIGMQLILGRIWVQKFIQTDDLRNLFDTYEKVKRLKRVKFLERDKRVVDERVVVINK